MADIEVDYKAKFSALAKAYSEADNIHDALKKQVEALRKEKDSFSLAVIAAKDDYKNLIKQASDYKFEFDEKKKKEKKEIELNKADAKKSLELAQEKESQAEKHLIAAQLKENRADGILKDAMKAKKEWEDKRENIKSFLISGN